MNQQKRANKEKQTEYEDRLKLYEIFLRNWEKSVESENETIKSFEKTLTTLASGALLFSITFVKLVSPEPSYENILFSAWVLFGISLVIILVGFLLSRQAHVVFRKYLEKNIYNKKRNTYKNRFAEITNVLNWASLLSFIFGVVLFGGFVYLNLSKAQPFSDIGKNQTTIYEGNKIYWLKEIGNEKNLNGYRPKEIKTK